MPETKCKYLYTVPVEMPRGTHYGSNYWIMPSRKLGRNVTAYSNLEHDYHVTLEMDPDVIFYCEQPLKDSVIIDGKRKETVFDVYIYHKNGTHSLREVKYAKELEEAMADTSTRVYKQIEAQRMISKRLGVNYGIVTEKDIHTGIYTIRNLELLAAKARRFNRFNKEQEKSFIAYLKHQKEPLSFGGLIDRGRLTEISGMDLIADLCFKGLVAVLNIDTEALGYKSEVYVCTKD